MIEVPWRIQHACHLVNEGLEQYAKPALSVICFLSLAGGALNLLSEFVGHDHVAYALGTTPTPESELRLHLPSMSHNTSVQPTPTFTPTPTYTPGGPTLTATLRATREWTWTPAFVGTGTPLAPMQTPTLTPTIAPGQ